jgi:dethiobiotin synthetase
MNPQAVPGIFVTGTNTGVGKTYVTACLARTLRQRGVRVGVYKPVASGCVLHEGQWISEDAIALWEAAGRIGTWQAVCPQRFAAPLAPPLAAAAEGSAVDPALLRSGLQYWLQHADLVLVEGAGGLMSPVTDHEFVADLAYDFGFPLLVVAPNTLGVINQTLQTLITAATFCDGLQVAGIVLNHPQSPQRDDLSLATNRAELARCCVPPVLAEVAWQGQEFSEPVPWETLAQAGQRWDSHAG